MYALSENKHKSYIKSHLELQTVITLIDLTVSPYFFVLSICLKGMIMFANFGKIQAMTLQDIQETKCYKGWTHTRTDGREDSIPTHKHSLRGV